MIQNNVFFIKYYGKVILVILRNKKKCCMVLNKTKGVKRIYIEREYKNNIYTYIHTYIHTYIYIYRFLFYESLDLLNEQKYINAKIPFQIFFFFASLLIPSCI